MWHKGSISVILSILIFAVPVFSQVTGLEKGKTLLDERKFAEARKFFEQRISENNENPDLYFYLGRSYLGDSNVNKKTRKKFIDKAIEAFERAIALDSNDSEYYRLLGNAYGDKTDHVNMLKKLGIAKKAKANFERAVELEPSNFRARRSLMEYFQKAPGMAGGDKKQAKVQAEEIMKIDKAAGHLANIWLYRDEKKHDLLEKEHLELIAYDQSTIAYQYNLGYFYHDTEQYEKAFPVFENIISQDANSIGAYYQLGRLASKSGQNLDRAMEALKVYVNKRLESPALPSKAWAYYRIGNIHEHKNENDLARVAYEKALNLDPKHEQAKESLKKIKK